MSIEIMNVKVYKRHEERKRKDPLDHAHRDRRESKDHRYRQSECRRAERPRAATDRHWHSYYLSALLSMDAVITHLMMNRQRTCLAPGVRQTEPRT
jgi:hypothetical protein